ncbi:hypothetical protein A2U01_0076299, partial [Trifolium medium]|nr:hypothetical protein [Trifolium medium]
HCLTLTPVSHRWKLRQFDIEVPDEEWFTSRLTVTGLADLPKTGCKHLDLNLISASAASPP